MADDRAGGLSRRGFLKGTAAASLGTAAAAAGVTPRGCNGGGRPGGPMPPHGAELRGLDLVAQSPTTEGRFGFMFKNQPPHAASDEPAHRLGQAMEEKPAIGTDRLASQYGGSSPRQQGPNDALNENPNPLLTSGFTFVGQFVDHDITFDTTTLSEQQSDPYATTNFRTPRYDLDAIYGRGPTADPQFYDPADRDKFLIVESPQRHTARQDQDRHVGQDLGGSPTWSMTCPARPRRPPGKAIIADPRNDQTLIVLQLHVAMQMFHNRLVDYMRALRVPRAAVFESARRMARWHYQWIVTHEFLPAIVGRTMADSVYKEVLTGVPIINIKYYKPTNPLGRPFIPVEFSVAAYRFGHSITRPRYTVQDFITRRRHGGGHERPAVRGDRAQTGADNRLNGSRELPPRLKMQWSKFFNADTGSPTARPVRQFDASLAGPLFKLPATALPDSNLSACCRHETSFGVGRWACPRGSRWLA